MGCDTQAQRNQYRPTNAVVKLIDLSPSYDRHNSQATVLLISFLKKNIIIRIDRESFVQNIVIWCDFIEYSLSITTDDAFYAAHIKYTKYIK